MTNEWKNDYDDRGYFVIRNYFSHSEIESLKQVILTFHQAWKKDNRRFYEEEAFNSSLITGSQYLAENDRVDLFNFISSNKMINLMQSIVPNNPTFMNTQLFFDPFNHQQVNFWHRDCQYDYDIEDQKKVIQNTQVVHLRVPLFDEPGMEIVPGSHIRWDNDEEFAVRQEENKHVSNEPLSTGKKIALNVGDILVFSADMIHRGLYGQDRLAFDTLIFDPTGDGARYADYVDEDCLPDSGILQKITNKQLFLNTINLKNEAELA